MKELPIVYNINNNFAPHCATNIASLLKNSSDKYLIHFFIISDSLSEENKNNLLKTSQLKQSLLTFIDIDPNNNEFSRFFVKPAWGHSIFYRLKIPSLLKDYSKGIYLDSDTVVTSDITELFEIDISNYLLGAVDEYELMPTIAEQQSKKLNLPVNLGYFNSGALLLNLDKMREEKLEQQCIDLLSSDMHPLLSFPDQDALNIITNGNFLHLPITWNFQVFSLITNPSFNKDQKLPKIIHFSAESKPWDSKLKQSSYPILLEKFTVKKQRLYDNEYFKYRAYTPWNNCKQNILQRIFSLLQNTFIKKLSFKLKRLKPEDV